MFRFQRLARAVVTVLLLFAATDLAFPAGCADAPGSPVATATLSSSDESSAPGHQGDNCFCCSRTVCTTTVMAVHPFVYEVPVPVAVMPDLKSLAVRRLYHPPIA